MDEESNSGTLSRRGKLKVVYECAIALLAATAVGLAVYDIQNELTPGLHVLDVVIWGIFVVDYVTRFILAHDKKTFFVRNIFDLLAIIPLSSWVRAFRFARVFRVFVFAIYGVRFFSKANRFFNTNGFRYIMLICMALCAAGTVAFHFTEGRSWGDSLWWAFVTMTTVGYGDITPVTLAGRVTAIMMMLVGIGFLGSFMSTVTAYCLEAGRRKNGTASEDVLGVVRRRLDNFSSLTTEDVETICVTLRALKESELARKKRKNRKQ